MDVKTIIKPEEEGAEKYHQQYGNRLVCVRHRIDSATRKRFTTVELIVEEQDDTREPEPTPNPLKPVRIGFSENEVRETLKQAGAFWDSKRNVWLLPLSKICELGLEKRIVGEVERIRNRSIQK